jgi:hypothetical protein
MGCSNLLLLHIPCWEEFGCNFDNSLNAIFSILHYHLSKRMFNSTKVLYVYLHLCLFSLGVCGTKLMEMWLSSNIMSQSLVYLVSESFSPCRSPFRINFPRLMTWREYMTWYPLRWKSIDLIILYWSIYSRYFMVNKLLFYIADDTTLALWGWLETPIAEIANNYLRQDDALGPHHQPNTYPSTNSLNQNGWVGLYLNTRYGWIVSIDCTMKNFNHFK